MITRAINLIMLCVVMLFFVFPAQVYAAAEKTCDCYCGTDKEGATRFPIGEDKTKLTIDACQAACKGSGHKMVACAATSGQLPSQNVSCFRLDQCQKQNGKLDSKYQPQECMKGMHYCFPDKDLQKATTLQVSIGGMTTTKDLGEYIAVVYKWMIGTGTLLAIIFIMVGGLQWSISSVSAEQLGNAKKRMMNGVIGLVLLLSTYLILQTVNPSLLKLQVPDFPMIRQTALVDGDDSCGYLTGDNGLNGRYEGSPFNKDAPAPKGGKPYTLEEPSDGKNCGSVAKVVKNWEGKSLPDGTTCTWNTCDVGSGKKCFVYSGGGRCLGCEEIVNGNAYITPSPRVCASLSLPETKGKRTETFAQGFLGMGEPVIRSQDVPFIKTCFWTKDGSLMGGADNPLFTSGTCAMLDINCQEIYQCFHYNRLAKVKNNDVGELPLYVMRLHGTKTGLPGSQGDLALSTVCNDDPCLVGVDDTDFPGVKDLQCRSEDMMSHFTGSWSDFVSLQVYECHE